MIRDGVKGPTGTSASSTQSRPPSDHIADLIIFPSLVHLCAFPVAGFYHKEIVYYLGHDSGLWVYFTVA